MAKPKLRLGYSVGFAPFVFEDPKNPKKIIGFEVDIIKEICKEIGFEPVFIQDQWEFLITGVENSEYDIAINGIEITNNSQLKISFSKPYYISFARIVILSDNKNITSLSDLVSKKVGCLNGTSTEKLLIENKRFDIKTYDSESSAYLDLLNYKIDAALIENANALYFIYDYSNYKVLGNPFGEINYGIVIKKDNLALLNNINYAISKIQKNGKLRKILDSWNLWNPILAKKFNDKSVSEVKPYNYDYFVNSHKTEMTFFDKISRYFNFLIKKLEF